MARSKFTVNGQIKNRMRIILAERGMTIRELADSIDYYYSSVRRFCCAADQEAANLLIMAKVCEVLKIQPGDIFVYEPKRCQNPFPGKEMSEFTVWLLDQAGRSDLVGELAEVTFRQIKEADPLVPLRSNAKLAWRDYLCPFGGRLTEALQAAWKEWARVNKRRQIRNKVARQERVLSLRIEH